MVVWLRMIRYLSLILILAAAASGCACFAQNPEAIPGAKARRVPSAQDIPTDPRIALEGKLPLDVEIRSADAMTPEDRELAASAAAAIRNHTALFELEFGEGNWQQDQLLCPAFPQHQFLRYTRNLGTGDVSMFAVSIPRGKKGRVRVLPILRRGFSLISPAPESKVTMAAFNEIEVEEPIGSQADWSAVSVCYAALTSERWNEVHGAATVGVVGSQTLQLGERGALTVALELADPASGRWAIQYNGAGQVVKTEYTPFGDLVWRRLPAPVADVKGKPLPGPVDQQTGKPLPAPVTGEKGRLLPVGPEPPGKPVPAPSSGDNQKPQ